MEKMIAISGSKCVHKKKKKHASTRVFFFFFSWLRNPESVDQLRVVQYMINSPSQ